MSMLSKQVKELREMSIRQRNNAKVSGKVFFEIENALSEAADTIEALSAKLAAANMERSERYYNYSNIYKDLDSLHSKILTSDLAEKVTKSEFMALHTAKHIFDNPCYTIDDFLNAIMRAINDTSYHIDFEDRDTLKSVLNEYLEDNNTPSVNHEQYVEKDDTYVSIENEHGALLKRIEHSVSNMENGGGWISCEDRLPEEEKYYLVTIINWEKKPAIEYCLFQNEKWYIVADGSTEENTTWKEEINSVIAWQPLPEPYRP